VRLENCVQHFLRHFHGADLLQPSQGEKMLLQRLRAIVLILAVCLPLSALAGPFSNLYVFGDSLSDTGNLATAYAINNSLPAPALPPMPAGSGFNGPYFQNDRLSTGPLWIEHLATGLGLSGAATPYLQGGNNYAFAGAETGTELNPPGVLAQTFGLWGSTHSFADPNALYVVVGGGNDMRAARSVIGGDATSRQLAAAAAITNLARTLDYLAAMGAKNILISTLPNLGYTPEAALLGLQAESLDASNQFNGLIQSSLVSHGNSLGLHMNVLDMAGLTEDIENHPAHYGITNTSLPCAGFEYSGGANCATSLFTDVLHPSAYAHTLIARAALDVLGIPEPGTLALLGLAVMLALTVSRRRQAT
jgi:phospholipase/lecithinase/hemolysin